MRFRILMLCFVSVFAIPIPAHASDHADFLGSWVGQWKTTFRNFEIVIHNVDGNEVLATYKWTANPLQRGSSAGERDIKGEFESDRVLNLFFNQNIRIRITREDDGTFSARWDEGHNTYTNFATLKKK